MRDHNDSEDQPSRPEDRPARLPESSEDRESSTTPHRLTAWTAGTAGVFVTGLLAVGDVFWPALVVLAGAVTASGLLLARRGGDKRYVLAGVVYCLGVAVVFEALGPAAVPDAYIRTVLPAVGGLGAISACLVLGKVAGRRAVAVVASRVVDDEAYVRQLWETVAAAGSLLAMVWLAVTFTEKVARYAVVSVGMVTALVLNLLGYEWLVSRFGVEVELIMATFVFCLLVWFHLLDTVHNSWQTARLSAAKAGSHRDRVPGVVGSDGSDSGPEQGN